MALTTVRPQGMGFVTGRRNLIINGAMQVAQRGTSFTDADGVYTLDRYRLNSANEDEFVCDVSQSTDAPSGFTTSMKVDVTTAETTIDADERVSIEQRIEAQNLQHLKYGTANAEATTLSMWVKSSVAGKYGVNIRAHDAADNYITSFTINTADTWEHKTMTIDGNTLSGGEITNDNGIGLWFRLMLVCGSDRRTSTVDQWVANTDDNAPTDAQTTWGTSASHEFYLTGVQWEVGENASDFEHRSFGEELALCQRYYEKSYSSTTNPGTATTDGIRHSSGAAGQTTTGELPMGINFLTTKRSAPSITLYDSAGNSGKCSRVDFGVTTHNNSTASSNFIGENAFMMSSSSGSTGSGVHCHFIADAEL